MGEMRRFFGKTMDRCDLPDSYIPNSRKNVPMLRSIRYVNMAPHLTLQIQPRRCHQHCYSRRGIIYRQFELLGFSPMLRCSSHERDSSFRVRPRAVFFTHPFDSRRVAWVQILNRHPHVCRRTSQIPFVAIPLRALSGETWFLSFFLSSLAPVPVRRVGFASARRLVRSWVGTGFLQIPQISSIRERYPSWPDSPNPHRNCDRCGDTDFLESASVAQSILTSPDLGATPRPFRRTLSRPKLRHFDYRPLTLIHSLIPPTWR